MNKSDELYQSFQAKLDGIAGDDGKCYHTTKAELVPFLKKIFEEKGASSACVYESPLMKEIGIVPGLKDAGITVHTDNIRKNAETDTIGITEVEYGLADLGTVVQMKQDADGRIAATLVQIHIALLKRSGLLDGLDTMIDKLCELPEMPNFVGFITGPSRTADIECVGTIGVHGPLQMMAIVIDDE